MSDISKRVLTGIFGCLGIYAAIEIYYFTYLVIFSVYYVACTEYFSIARQAHLKNLQSKLLESFSIIPFSVYFVPVSVFAASKSEYREGILLLGLYTSFIMSVFVRLFEYSKYCADYKPEDPIKFLSFTVLSVILTDTFFCFFFGYPFCYTLLLANVENSKQYLFLWIFTTFQCDNGALLFGRLFGSYRPFPHISPAKSIQGVFGAYILPYFSLLIFVYFPSTRFTPHLEHWDVLVISIASATLAIGGDLTESFLKRVAGVKDSGLIFPGHGGMLDRLDSLVWVAPFIFYYSTYFLSS